MKYSLERQAVAIRPNREAFIKIFVDFGFEGWENMIWMILIIFIFYWL